MNFRGDPLVPNLVTTACLLLTISPPGYCQFSPVSNSTASSTETGAPQTANGSSNATGSTSGSMGGATLPLSPSQKDLGAWTDINTKARAYYAQWRQRHRDGFGPLIIAKGEELTLLRNGQRETANVIPSDYSMLKSVAHVPLAVFALLRDFTEKPLAPVRVDDLKMWKEDFLTGKTDLAKWKLKFTAATYERQLRMIDSAASFIDEVVANKQVTNEQLRKYTRENSKWIFANVNEAIASQLSAVDKQVRQWRSKMTDEQWGKTQAIVFGFHMPRKENSMSQYFLSLFHEKGEGEKLIYVEGPSYEDDYGIELLATHEIDRQIAVDFFNDKWRMHRDLLSDGAKKYLKKHPPSWNRK